MNTWLFMTENHRNFLAFGGFGLISFGMCSKMRHPLEINKNTYGFTTYSLIHSVPSVKNRLYTKMDLSTCAILISHRSSLLR